MKIATKQVVLLRREGVSYLLNDNFTDTAAAGAVNGTLATPSGGARTVTDGNSKLSIGSGVANFATGGVGAGNPGIWYPSITTVAGRAVIGHMNMTSGSAGVLGFDANQASFPNDGLRISTTTAIALINNNGAGSFVVGTVAVGSDYYLALVQRGTGTFGFIKGGMYTAWTLLYPNNLIAAGARSPSLVANSSSSVFTSAFVCVPQSLIIIAPLASDAFTRADGLLGNTGGGGGEEAGGSGKAWTAQKGTWGIATNKAACSALTDSVGIATVPCGSADVMAEIVATRSAGTSGLCLRYTDASNYIKAVHNGTNVQVIEVVAGTPNTLTNSAATYGAAFRLIVSLNGNKVRTYYNDVLMGAEVTTAVTTGSSHGLFTDDTGATFDNFVVYAKGNGGEYDSLLNPYISNP